MYASISASVLTCGPGATSCPRNGSMGFRFPNVAAMAKAFAQGPDVLGFSKEVMPDPNGLPRIGGAERHVTLALWMQQHCPNSVTILIAPARKPGMRIQRRSTEN